MSKPSIVFFGTGAVAAKSLQLLAKSFEIEAVITKPKPPHHRGEFPVIDVAKSLKLPFLTVLDKQSVSETIKAASFKSRLGILIDFGILVTQGVIDSFEKGIVNSHFSLLPQWRGADPITYSILSGQKMTGVSIMILVEALDEGPLLAVGEQPLNGTETTPELTESLIQLSDALLKKELPVYLNGKTSGVPQSKMSNLIKGYPEKPSYSRKLTKADGKLDWNKSAEQLEREVRAYNGWPGSYTTLNGIDLVVTKAHIADASGKPGTYTAYKKSLLVYCAEQSLSLDEVKPPGKPAMLIDAFLAGYRNRL